MVTQAPPPPYDTEAEQAVLGAMLTANDAIAAAIDANLTGRDFYHPVHEEIYDAITALYQTGTPCDPLTVRETLDQRGLGHQLGDPTYLVDLMGLCASPASAEYYAAQVADRSRRRAIINAGQRLMQVGSSTDTDWALDQAQQTVFGLDRAADSGWTSAGPLANETLGHLRDIANGDGPSGLATGVTDLDNLLGGLRSGQLTIVGARPGMGKSVMAANITRHASIHNHIPSALFSLEMSRTELMVRILAGETSLSMTNLWHGKIDAAGWETLEAKTRELQDAPLYIDDQPDVTVGHIRSTARRMAARGNLGLVVVDYIQLMSPGGKVENRQQEVSVLSRELKMLAKELDVPVVALAQLNRTAEQRADKRPMLSDLRESGALEQDADNVILLHRDDAYELESDRPGEADLIVAKHRNGPTGTVTVAFQGHYSRFANLARP